MAPESLDVVVASHLFGDILTDLGAAIQGGLGFAASANLNPDRERTVDVRTRTWLRARYRPISASPIRSPPSGRPP